MQRDESPFARTVSAYFDYLETLRDVEEQWVQDDVSFGSAECQRISEELSRRAIELNAMARDWAKRASETKAKEKAE